MKNIIIHFDTNIRPVKEKAENRLQWYDDIRKEMLFFTGGKLNFKYIEDDYLITMGEEERKKKGIKTTFRMLPKVEDMEIVKYKRISNKKDVEKWFDEYDKLNRGSVSKTGETEISFQCQVNDNDAEDFIFDLDRKRFHYDIL